MTNRGPSLGKSATRALPGASDALTVVGIGASAGGLEACTKLVSALPAQTGIAFILVQHLDPNHQSMMVDLLSGHTAMAVVQAEDGMRLSHDHLYVIPPGTYLSVADGALHLSRPKAPHGARLPFDYLLHSLAEAYGQRAVCVVLSGSGADGSAGLTSVKAADGLVIVQNPDEAGYDGMPRSAIRTGLADHIIPAAEIPTAIIKYDRRLASRAERVGSPAKTPSLDRLPDIIKLLRAKSLHDFSLYKRGTLQRRIERRMAACAVPVDDFAAYLGILERSQVELELLAKDLLINVTSFFRDPEVFELLAQTIVPDLVRDHPADQPLRIWIAGCSTGEETYSLAMLFREQIVATKSAVKLQIFASDVDPDAVASAREGFYPATIEETVSPARLATFFIKEEHGYRVLPELRASVVFAVQDVLADPPFSRIDMVSCRNLLIYLRPEAQARVIALFHFALRERGVLLLGSAETVGNVADRFEMISKDARLYRHTGRARVGELGIRTDLADLGRVRAPVGPGRVPSRQYDLAELGKRLVLEAYAPASILINRRLECVFTLGPTDRYLRVAPGRPTHDLLAMARPGLRTRLRSAIHKALQAKSRVVVGGGRAIRDGDALSFNVEIQPVTSGGEELLLVCFVDASPSERSRTRSGTNASASRVAELEQELDATRADLHGAVHDLELANEEQKIINEEALSVNEEYQSTNEELLTSKEELQSLNEELTALNSQLHETLEQQRKTSDDLQNVLYSTDVATLFLDADLKIRFFTPASKLLFSVIPSDVGRPLADLRSLADDPSLQSDARAVLLHSTPIEREIETPEGLWFRRRILPYRTHAGQSEGVVITFNDVTRRKQTVKALDDARRRAELADAAKSRFLAAASHDLRQPLQSLALLQGLLSKAVEGERARKLVARLDDAVGAMSSMLNALLDINEIETGVVRAEHSTFQINELLEQLRAEFTFQAEAAGISLHVVPCSVWVDTDIRLLEQILRNLLSNALKYTKHGKVLLGCRRRRGMLRIEVWDTGIGIDPDQLATIFDEYHQVDNPARDRSRGLGLGLSIVRRQAELLGQRVVVRSWKGKGSVFSIEAKTVTGRLAHDAKPADVAEQTTRLPFRAAKILVVDDDPELRELLEQFLGDEGHRVITAADGNAALELVAHRSIRPDLLLADYNLPGGMDGLQLAVAYRGRLGQAIPVIILTGDISTSALQTTLPENCEYFCKPVRLEELSLAVLRLLPAARPIDRAEPAPTDTGMATVFIIDDEIHVRDTVRDVLQTAGYAAHDYATAEAFLDAYRPTDRACVLIDAYLPGMSGLDLLRRLHDAGNPLPAIMMTGQSDVAKAVTAMKAGAVDYIEKPVSRDDLLGSVARALEQSLDRGKVVAWQQDAAQHVAALTERQKQIMNLVLAGQPSKNIAADLNISQRTVENHRASIMKKTGVSSLPALARLAVAAGGGSAPDAPNIRSGLD